MSVKCPICKKEVDWEENPYRPFCSERCKLIDLGQWAKELYKFPGDRGSSESEQSGPGEKEKEDENSNNGKSAEH
jgi:endogenous inhibitor of DNA gyrase (YacG/DUF329 family)